MADAPTPIPIPIVQDDFLPLSFVLLETEKPRVVLNLTGYSFEFEIKWGGSPTPQIVKTTNNGLVTVPDVLTGRVNTPILQADSAQFTSPVVGFRLRGGTVPGQYRTLLFGNFNVTKAW